MQQLKFLLFVGVLMGLAWAVRGHFGHEWGAAWAGAIGGMAVVTASIKKDWIAQLPYLSALSALGWGVGGMMSYGIVIGYCRGDDFPNVLYGYGMLAVIGGLYGCIGGGFLGLGLETSEDKQPKWSTLITEMVAGAILIWGIIIYQLEWFMTPPRSELWAACLGAALAMIWYMFRNGFYKALKVALWTMVGAGFGFAAGNFIQVLGQASGIAYNWWNVMEFTLGLCGGLSMAYAVATTRWERTKIPSPFTIFTSLTFVFLLLPLTNFISAFTHKKLSNLGDRLEVENIAVFITTQNLWGSLCLLVCAFLGIWFWLQKQKGRWHTYSSLWMPLILSSGYVMQAMILKGFFSQPLSLGNSVSTYIPLLLAALFIGRKITDPLSNLEQIWSKKKTFNSILVLLVALVLFALISVFVNDPPQHLHERF